jgi:methionyl-tRNA formyltransferase
MVFMGTPEFAVPSLKALITAGAPILLVVTQPDRPKGRGRKLAAAPVKELALAHGLPVFQPERIGRLEAVGRIVELRPVCITVVAYGQLLPARLLEYPSLGAVNLHASLLPKYRGPAPIHRALINGEATTGVTTMLMDPGMDTGDILLCKEVAIGPEETAGSLYDRLAGEGALLLLQTLEHLQEGTLKPRAQDHSQSTYAPLLTAADARVNWQEAAVSICRRIRGLDPSPGAFTSWQGWRLKLFGCRALTIPAPARPGTVLAIGAEGLQVATGEGAAVVKALQLEGRRRLSVPDFARGYTLKVGTVLGE